MLNLIAGVFLLVAGFVGLCTDWNPIFAVVVTLTGAAQVTGTFVFFMRDSFPDLTNNSDTN